MIYEEKFGDLAEALDSYRRLTWGSHASPARARVAVMTKKHLQLHTERTFRTDEKVTIKLNVRNMEKLKFKQYFLDLEAYFRKTHATGQVEQLDVDLIQPDKIWEVKIDNYAKYKPIEQEVEIPFDKNAAGVCLINVSENDLEATTLVIRSDLEMIVKSSRREALVFVQNMRTGEPAKGVDLLFSDGKEVFTTGKTEADGVFRGSFEELKSAGLLRVFASNGRSVASNLLDLSGMQFSRGLSAKGYIYTDRPAYQPGQMVSLRGIVRDVKDGSYIAPTGQEYLVSVTDSGGRLLWQKPRKLSEFGTFHTQLTLDKRAPLGKYTIALRRRDNPAKTYSAVFQVEDRQGRQARGEVRYLRAAPAGADAVPGDDRGRERRRDLLGLPRPAGLPRRGQAQPGPGACRRAVRRGDHHHHAGG